MIESTSQWLYIISNPKKTNITTLIPFIKEGGNVAIASNNTIVDDKCTRDEKCLYHELLKLFAISLSKLVREEEAIYGQISDEEWEAIRLSKRERRDSMLEYIKVNNLIQPRGFSNQWYAHCTYLTKYLTNIDLLCFSTP